MGRITQNRAGAWNPEGTIVIASNNILYRVSAEGGRPTPLTALNVSRHETFLTSPDFLPDGRRFLYTAWSPEESNRAVYVGSLDSKDSTRLFAASSKALYADPGYLLYHREGVLLAQPFDAKKLEVTGEPVRIADQLAYTSTGAHAAFSVSQNGVLTYRDDSTSLQQFVWVDRTGKTLNSAGEPGRYGGFDLGPDGRQIAVARDDPSAPGNRDIWLLDPDRGGATRLTTDPAGEDFPVWSPDAHQIAFSSNRQGAYRIFWKQASGLGDETLLSESRRIDVVTDWSKDGRYIAYTSLLSSSDLYVLPQFGDRQPVAIVQSRFNKRQARFSFDSRWLAYASDESGQWQIDVISFPAADQKRQVSTSGGVQPRWKRDGTELYYLAPDGDLMAVTMKIGPTVEPGMPRALFDTKLVSVTGNVRDNYAVTPDGDRFLIKRPVAALKTDPITVVLNWQLALGARERR
jgi:Tol biopolymer transport system component